MAAAWPLPLQRYIARMPYRLGRASTGHMVKLVIAGNNTFVDEPGGFIWGGWVRGWVLGGEGDVGVDAKGVVAGEQQQHFCG